MRDHRQLTARTVARLLVDPSVHRVPATAFEVTP